MKVKVIEVSKFEKVRTCLKPGHVMISEKELINVMRCFSNIKNQIRKEFDDASGYLSIKNKAIMLGNVFDKGFVVKKLRKDISQEHHSKLNALLLIARLTNDFRSVPVDIDYFKRLMKCQ